MRVWHWIEEDGEEYRKSDLYLKGKYGFQTKMMTTMIHYSAILVLYNYLLFPNTRHFQPLVITQRFHYSAFPTPGKYAYLMFPILNVSASPKCHGVFTGMILNVTEQEVVHVKRNFHLYPIVNN